MPLPLHRYLPGGAYRWRERDCLTVTAALFRARNLPPPDYSDWHRTSELAAVRRAVRAFGSVAAGHRQILLDHGAEAVADLPAEFVIGRLAPGLDWPMMLGWLPERSDSLMRGYFWDADAIRLRRVYGSELYRLPS